MRCGHTTPPTQTRHSPRRRQTHRRRRRYLMPWFKVDDSFYDHPKVKELSSHAVRLWLMAGSRSARYLLDGWVDQAFVNTFANGSRSARALVAANLWYEGHRDGEEGWYFHDWAEYQPMRADVERR